MTRVLFVCSQNRMRSPTAEQVFAGRPGFEVASAGLSPSAATPVSAELVRWADLILVMERVHRSTLKERFRSHLEGKRIVCLEIPDEYGYMDPALVKLLETKAGSFFEPE